MAYTRRQNNEKAHGGGAITLFGATFTFKTFPFIAKVCCPPENFSGLPAAFYEISAVLPDIELVSFDIFDTAVVRLLPRPKDLFKIIEKQYALPSFYKNRCLAARLVRAENKAKGILEITLDEIYGRLRAIDSSITLQKAEELKQAEINLELRLCRRNNEIGALFDYLKKNGKKICFTSDMYLPGNVVEQILKKCGYEKYDFLYLSSQDRLTKKDGGRFLNCSAPERILHIGDNEDADFFTPLRSGLNAFLYKRSFHCFLSGRLMKKNKKNLYLDFAGCLAKQKDFPSYWFSIGYQYVGPLLSCFCTWLKKETADSVPNPLCFLARDGMIMRHVYETMFPKETTTYLYCSRALTSNTDCRETYVDYLKQTLPPCFCVIDVGRKGTIQDNLKRLLPETKINGYYVDLRISSSDKSGFYTNGDKNHRRFLDFLDFLFMAPASLCIGIEKKDGLFAPVYLPIDADERKRHEIADEIHSGTLAFIRDAAAFTDILSADSSAENVLNILEILLRFPKQEQKYLENIKIPFGMKNEKSRFLLSPRLNIKCLYHPVSFFNIWRKSTIKRF